MCMCNIKIDNGMQDLKAPHHIVRTLFKLYDHARRVYAYSLSLSAIIARIDFIGINVYLLSSWHAKTNTKCLRDFQSLHPDCLLFYIRVIDTLLLTWEWSDP